MTGFDFAVVTIVGLSALISLLRGMVRESFGLASWVVAFLLARAYAMALAPHLPAALSNDAVRYSVAFAAVFVAALILLSLVTANLSRWVKQSGLGALDRALGVGFGVLRGAFISVLLVLFAGLTDLPREPDWQQALLSPPLEELALRVKPLLPADVAQRVRYD